MICFSSMGRIRLNSIIKRVFSPSSSPDICCSGHSALWGNGNVDRVQEMHVPAGAGRASRCEISLDLPQDYRGLRRGWLIILQEPLSWKAGVLSLIIPSQWQYKGRTGTEFTVLTGEIQNLKETGICFFLTVFVNLAACLFVLNGYCAFWIQNLIIFN